MNCPLLFSNSPFLPIQGECRQFEEIKEKRGKCGTCRQSAEAEFFAAKF
jgi:hypothetical protein